MFIFNSFSFLSIIKLCCIYSYIFVICRCFALWSYPVGNADELSQLNLEYNVVFQQLKMLFIDFFTAEDKNLKRAAESAAARKEAARSGGH